MGKRENKKQVRKQWAVDALLAKTGGRCYLCGDLIPIEKPKECSEKTWNLIRLTRDHVIPKSQGGEGYRTNLMPAHGWCNERRNDLPIAYHMMFVLFRRGCTTVGQPTSSSVKLLFLAAKRRWCHAPSDSPRQSDLESLELV